MKRFIGALSLVVLQTFSVAHGQLVDLPNPNSDELPAPPPAANPTPKPTIVPQRPSTGGAIGSNKLIGVTRLSDGLFYRLELKPAVEIRNITVYADKSQFLAREAYVYTVSGQRVKIQELSKAKRVANQTTLTSEALNINEKVSTLDLRLESMQAEADVVVTVNSVSSEFRLKIAGEELSCRENSDAGFQPYNSEVQILLGVPGYSYAEKKACDVAVTYARRSGVAVCNWDGSSYNMYRTTNGTEIGGGKGYQDPDDCNQAVATARSGLICNWNGNGYSPYYVRHAGNVGKPDYGWNDLSECADSLKQADTGVLCNWNGDNYSPYIVRTNTQIGLEDHGFEELKECQKASSKLSSQGFVCNWSSKVKAYARYQLKAPMVGSGQYETLNECLGN